jgi:type VI secretion system protein ImpH
MKTAFKTDLKLDMLKKGHAFSFYQVIRLLGHMQAGTAKRGSTDRRGLNDIRIRPNLSMAFPASDVEKVEERGEDEAGDYLITANILGLYGSTSPLPTFYTEELIAEETNDESVSRDFIDIINHRLYELLFRCWAKYRQYLQVLEEQHAPDLERLFCLLGLGEKELRDEISEPYRLLRYIGLFAQFPRSVAGLKALLRDALGDIPLTIIPCVERKAKIPETQRCCLGISGCILGQNAYLGEELADRMGKFRIQVGPMNTSEFQTFFSGNEAYERLTFLTRLYLTEPLAYDLELIQAKDQARTVSLGNAEHAMLGTNTWVFSGEYLNEVRMILTPRLN